MTGRVWWRGALRSPGDAAVGVGSTAVQVGVMPFDTLRVHRRVPLHVQAHLDRFERSCRVLGLEPPPRADAKEAVEAVAADGPVAGLVRAAALPTEEAAGFEAASDACELLVTGRPLPHVPPEGMRVVTAPFEALTPRGWIHSAKVTGRAPNVLARAFARSHGAHEALFQSPVAGYTEGTRTNLFVVHDTHLVTAPGSHGLLPGLTREWVLAEARRMGLVTHHMSVTLRDLTTADEVFLSGTGIGVAAVVELDGRPVGGGAPGPLVRSLVEAHARHLDDAAGPVEHAGENVPTAKR